MHLMVRRMLSVVIASEDSLSLVAVLALGFFLGMRHATDADHVVAISTTVSRENGSVALRRWVRPGAWVTR